MFIHEVVFHRRWHEDKFGHFWWSGEVGLMGTLAVPKYSEDIALAWSVVDRLCEAPYVKVRCSTSHYHGDYCSVTAADPSQRDEGDPVINDAVGIWGETMPAAICLAAYVACLGTKDPRTEQSDRAEK